jgi:hypothetical protein
MAETRLPCASRGDVDLSRYSCAEPLHATFAAMLAANPERNVRRG